MSHAILPLSDAGVETGRSSARLVGIVFNFDSLSSGRSPGRSFQRFLPERVFCSLSAGARIDGWFTIGHGNAAPVRWLKDRNSDQRVSQIRERHGGMIFRPNPLPPERRERHQHSENKETIGPSNGREDISPPKPGMARLRPVLPLGHARTERLTGQRRTEGKRPATVPALDCSGFLSSLFSTCSWDHTWSQSSKCPFVPMGERGVLFRSCLLFLLPRVASLFRYSLSLVSLIEGIVCASILCQSLPRNKAGVRLYLLIL